MANIFCAEITDYKIVYNVLKAVLFKEYCIMHPLEEGLKITVEEMKCVETSVYIPQSLFTEYELTVSTDVKFKISLKVLTECLNIYGDDGNPSLKMSYKGSGSPLILVIKHSEENITVDCEIKTLDAEEFTELSLSDECMLNKVVVNASPLVKALSEIDSTSDELQLLLSPDPPHFRIVATSISGNSQVDISKTSEAMVIFQCKSECKAVYAFSNIKQILKVMHFAHQITISLAEMGLLSFQLLIKTDEKELYVEYYVTSMFENDR